LTIHDGKTFILTHHISQLQLKRYKFCVLISVILEFKVKSNPTW